MTDTLFAVFIACGSGAGVDFALLTWIGGLVWRDWGVELAVRLLVSLDGAEVCSVTPCSLGVPSPRNGEALLRAMKFGCSSLLGLWLFG